MPSQFPAFRLTVARQMEAYRDRIANRIREEAAKRGESAPDLAHELGVYPTTAERWFRGDRTPQRRHRKQLARHWDIPFDALEPDFAAEERKLRDQLNRIEAKLDHLIQGLDLASPALDDLLDEVASLEVDGQEPQTPAETDLEESDEGEPPAIAASGA